MVPFKAFCHLSSRRNPCSGKWICYCGSLLWPNVGCPAQMPFARCWRLPRSRAPISPPPLSTVYSLYRLSSSVVSTAILQSRIRVTQKWPKRLRESKQLGYPRWDNRSFLILCGNECETKNYLFSCLGISYYIRVYFGGQCAESSVQCATATCASNIRPSIPLVPVRYTGHHAIHFIGY